jgi:hypothetical protein
MEKQMLKHSLFYSLEPFDLKRWSVESVSSYVARLSQAHCTLPHHILKILIPLGFERGQNPTKIMRRISERPWLLNRDGVITEGIVGALENATNIPDLLNLTAGKLAKSFDIRFVLRRSAAWCPKCINEMREAGSVYMPLLWTLDPVAVCPKHKMYLASECPHCGTRISWLKGRYRLGYCDQCFQWLGTAYEERSSIDQESDWISRQYQFILQAMQSEEKKPLPLELFGAFLLCLSRAGKKRLFEVHRERLSMRFHNRLDLDKFIKYLYTAKIEINQVFHGLDKVGKLSETQKLLEVLNEEYQNLKEKESAKIDQNEIQAYIEACLAIPENEITFAVIERQYGLWKGYVQYYFPDLAERVRERQQGLSDNVYQEIEARLDQTIESGKGGKSLTAVAENLPKSLTTISNRFPERSQAIVDAFQSEVHGNLEKRIEAARQEVLNICEALFADGIYPSQHKVSDRLSQPSLIKNPRVEGARKEFLKEMGLYDLYHDS